MLASSLKSSPSSRGFTLVELAIVLVIIGLLVGGVLAGESLIHASQLKAVSTEYNRYVTAMTTFRDKYSALPGDMPNAVNYWGAAAGGTAKGIDTTCQNYATPSTGTATCNGDGNGQIDGGAANSAEAYRAWQHLSNAGLIAGSYSGVAEAPNSGRLTFAIGINGPSSKLSPAGWAIFYQAPLATTDPAAWTAPDNGAWEYAGAHGNSLYFGTIGIYNISVRGGALTPTEAWNIDSKMDDGKPNTGNILGDTPADSNYFAGGICSTDTYQIGSTGKICSLEFLTGL